MKITIKDCRLNADAKAVHLTIPEDPLDSPILPSEEGARRIPGIPPAEEEALQSVDDRAEKEAQQLSSGRTEAELKREAVEHEHDRTEKFRDFFDGLVTIGIRVAFWVAIAFGITWTWHLLTPPCLHWLSEEQLNHLQNIVTGGVLASLLSDHFKRRLG